MKNFNKIQPYLPSKNFQKIIGSVVLIIILFFGVNYFISRKESFENKALLDINNKTISEIRSIDTDYDGLYDWEEKLWGTDINNKFTFDGIADTEYVSNKKKSLNINEANDKIETETDKFAKEFFSTYLALQTNQVDPNTINNFSQALGNSIVNKEIANSYELNQIKTTNDTTSENQIKYYLELKKLFESYQNKGLGNELEIASRNLVQYTNQGKAEDIEELLVIGDMYIEFTKKALQITVPVDLAEYHLDIINASNNAGKSVIDMSKVIGDPVVGLSAISNYEKNSQDLVDSVEKLEQELEKVL